MMASRGLLRGLALNSVRMMGRQRRVIVGRMSGAGGMFGRQLHGAVSGGVAADDPRHSRPQSLADLKESLSEHQRYMKALEYVVAHHSEARVPKTVCMLGAGLSSGAALKYLLSRAKMERWTLLVGDRNPEHAQAYLDRFDVDGCGEAFEFDVGMLANAEEGVPPQILEADLVISLLPASMHTPVIELCVEHGQNVLTASYVSEEVAQLDEKARAHDCLVMMECGVDPGIDHMSASVLLDEIREEGGSIMEFESFTGGLVADESDNNPWGYKFTWNPRNVVLAGRGVSHFIHNSNPKYIPYEQVFKRFETVHVMDQFGVQREFEGYPNRDSLMYRSHYGLETCPTVYRGTLRRPGFCGAWDVFAELGMTDDSYYIEDVANMTYRDFINSFLMWRKNDSVELKLCYHLGLSFESPEFQRISWLGIFENKPIGLDKATPAQVLEKLLTEKLAFEPGDRDMIVMHHRIGYETADGEARKRTSSMTVTGDGDDGPGLTAMAKTVGFPLAMIAARILKDNVPERGVQIPLMPALTKPVLAELATEGIEFVESDVSAVAWQ